MIIFINLLPWRQQQRLLRLRFWCLLAAGYLLLLLMAGVHKALLLSEQQEQLRIHAAHLLHAQNAFQRQFHSLTARVQRQQAEQKKHIYRQIVKDWEVRFIRLAARLPRRVWLNAVSFVKGQLTLRGHATTVKDFRSLESRLRLLDGVSSVQVGAVERESDGKFRFVFTLYLAGENDVI